MMKLKIIVAIIVVAGVCPNVLKANIDDYLNFHTVVINGETVPAELEVINGKLKLSSTGVFDPTIEFSNSSSIIDNGTNLTLKRSTNKIVLTNSNVGIGVSTPTCKLDVDGKVRAEQVEIIANVPSSDYVFEPDYNLLPISDLEMFLKTNKHLPEVPSAAEFKANGYNIGEMDDLLLRKIEELTLYIIEQEKNQKILEARIKKLESK